MEKYTRFNPAEICLTKYLFFTGKGVVIAGVTGLVVANLDPAQAAREYREK